MADPPPPVPPDCNGRFTIQSFLGSGGMGSVYEAYDHQRQAQVALKIAREAGAPWLYRFKQEFRSLAEIVHPNLVTLHELIEWDGQWLFTMERVPGMSFHQARRAGGAPPATIPAHGPRVESSTSAEDTPALAPAAGRERSPPRRSDPIFSDVGRIADAMRQLCDGLEFLHQSGLAHGDIKPANALITPDGRVVILDFGISRDWKSDGGAHEAHPFLGTPGYLSPERLGGGPATPASDMYAVGVILFEVLAGRDFDDVADLESTLRASRSMTDGSDPGFARRRALEDLCLRLMSPDPAARPTAAQARDAAAHGSAEASRTAATEIGREPEKPGFVARQGELEAARNLLLDRRPQAPRVVLVSGDSGIGKSELMRRLLDEQLPSSCIVLEGKCYEREQVPYRALDRVIDVLSSKLLFVEHEELEALAWADVLLVARMFPVLRRVPMIDRLCQKNLRSDLRDPRDKRRAAALILGRLMELVASAGRVVVFIDDIHWGDEESAIILRDLLLAEHGPDLSFVGCHRRSTDEHAFLESLLDADPPLRHAEITLGPLSRFESEELARVLLGPNAEPDHVARVADEANGNPFLVRELISFGMGRGREELALRSAVARHVDLLSHHARRLLEILSVAGRRLDIGLVREATGIGQTLEATIMLLRSQHLIKTSNPTGEQIEPYHERIREVIAQGLKPDVVTACHRDLARALEKLGEDDPAILAFHLEGAGESLRAGEQVLRAARLAEASLAHLSAAQHYAKAVELFPASDPRQREALHAEARSLSAAGRAARAAPIYMELAKSAAPDEALELRRAAAEAWAFAGEFDPALEVLPDVLRASGVHEPRTRLSMLIAIARQRLWLRRRKYRYTAVTEADVAPSRIVRIDAWENAADLFSTVDLVRAYHAHLARMRESLIAGEPRRVARGLVETVVMESIGGEDAGQTAPRLLRIATQASEMGDFKEEQLLIRYAAGVHAALNGRYAEVIATLGSLADAPELSRSMRQQRTLRSVLGYSHWWLGQWRTLSHRYRAWILDALERGDQLTACTFRLEQNGQWSHVLDDEPELAMANVARAYDSPLGREISFGHLAAKQTRAWIALYMGRPEEAKRALQLKGGEKPYLRVQRSRMEIALLHAYAELARGRAGVRNAKTCMRRLEKEGPTWVAPIVQIIAASLAELEDRRYESVASLRVAISKCDQLGYEMFSAAAAARLGELMGGAEGDELRRRALARISEQGAVRPDRIVRALAPGFADTF